MKRILTSISIAIGLAVVLHGQGTLTGKWEGKTPNGFALALDLTASQSALTGTLTREDQTVNIADGRVSNNTFTFKATLGDQTEAFTGELSANEITIWLDRQGRANATVLKRVNK